MATLKNSESGTTYRNRLSRSIVLAIRLLMQQKRPDNLSQDMAAYVVLALEKMAESADATATAWEKRDYWLKADHFRQEWAWVEHAGHGLETALIAEEWDKVAQEMVEVGQHLQNIQISENNRIGEPWTGAWEIFSRRMQG
ncbi:MAG: hypothetical protein AB2L21_08890 [Anaerolineaceae bacterium]